MRGGRGSEDVDQGGAAFICIFIIIEVIIIQFKNIFIIEVKLGIANSLLHLTA